MTTNHIDPIRYLRGIADYSRHEDVAHMIRQRDYVLRRYQPVFSRSHIAKLSADDFGGFLRYENNCHWWGLQRDEARIVSNMDLLRWALDVLVDTDRPVQERIDEVDPASGPKPVPGMERAIYTPILLVSEPEYFGVWNSVAESAMQRLGLWPELTDTATTGEQYVEVNEMLLTVAAELKVDLWTLDALWWGAEKEHDPSKHFTARRSVPPPRSPRTKTATTPSRRAVSRKPQASTFVCESCFQQKQVNLVSATNPRRCVDCA